MIMIVINIKEKPEYIPCIENGLPLYFEQYNQCISDCAYSKVP